MPSEEVLVTLEELHKEIDRMKPSIRQVEIVQELMNQVSKLPQDYFNLIKDIKVEEKQFKTQLSQELSTHADHLRQHVKKLTDRSEEVNNSLSGHEVKLSEHNIALASLSENIRVYLETMIALKIGERVDHLQKTSELKFDKLDSTISSVQLGIQNVQSRLNVFETNLSNVIRDESEKQRAQLQQLHGVIGKGQQQQKTFAIITWVIVAIAVTLILLLKK